MASIIESAVPATDSPALVRALPYAKSVASLLLSSLVALSRSVSAALSFAVRILTHPIVFLSPFSVLLYILAPAIVFIQLLLEVFAYSPYRAILYLSDAFYPAYVLLGVACITGALLGFGGRLVVWGALQLLSPPPAVLLVDAPGKNPRIR
ncbi:hypothetical protein DFH06DRAFT_1190647 [Mycena polygramma]|nr:hypothetical protein DFH06DRAFT_1190647 [Mycena polygramma]